MAFNPFIAVVAVLQVIGGLYEFATGSWRLGAINCLVGIANGVLSTLKG